jgi:hypothetical protein
MAVKWQAAGQPGLPFSRLQEVSITNQTEFHVSLNRSAGSPIFKCLE